MSAYSSLALLLIALTCFSYTAYAQNGTYLITAYNYLRPLSVYRTTVQWVGSPFALTITANLVSATKTFSASGVTKLSTGSSTFLDLKLKDIPIEQYTLTLTVQYDTNKFVHTKTLQCLDKLSIFIQLDKAIFQPGQKVNYRVLVVDPDLKPLSPTTGTLTIKDAQTNVIKFEKGIQIVNGIYKGSLQLSDRPVLGDWTVEVQISGVSASKKFSVDEYVLPKFEFSVIPPASVTFEDKKFTVDFQAKYTYQKPLPGEVTAKAKINGYCYSSSPCETTDHTATLDEYGKASITFNLDEIPNLRNYGSSVDINVTAVVEENKTGRTQTQSATFKITRQSSSIAITATPRTYKPGLPLTVNIQLKDSTGGPLQNPNPNTATVTFGSSSSTVTATLDSNGSGQVVYSVPSTQTGSLYVQVTHKTTTSSIYVPQATAQLTNYINIKIIGGPTKVGDTQKFEITSTFNMPSLYYEIMGRTQILESKSVNLSANTKRTEIGVKITHDMTPSSFIIASVLNPNGEIVVDVLEFTANGFFLTPVQLTATPDDVTPNSSVQISVTTNPFAFVCLSAVDQSVLLLKSGNDVLQPDVISDFKKYVGPSVPQSSPIDFLPGGPVDFRRKRIALPPTDYYTTPNKLAPVFQTGNVFYFTNSVFDVTKIYRPIYIRPRPDMFMKGGGGGGGMAINNANFAAEPEMTMASMLHGETDGVSKPSSAPISSSSNAPPQLRFNFPESWIWTEIEAGANGIAKLNAQAPDTITSWVFSAIAMDKIKGLGISGTQPKVRVFRPFFISLNLPYSIVRGEDLKLQAILFNYLDKDVNADVTMTNENGDFKFTDGGSDQSTRKNTILVKAGKSVSVEFSVSGVKLGKAIVTISAISKDGSIGDIIKQTLLVKAEGKTVYFNRPALVDLSGVSTFELPVDIEIAKNAVQGSEYLEVFSIGDIMGPTLNNLDQMLQMPCGCGEQNMITMIPNVVALVYLQTVGRATPAIKQKAINFMQSGYQRELTYKRDDNSFSAFGQSDPSGSTMLTAFVVKTFYQCKPYITVSDEVLNKALEYLSKNQNPDGSFKEPGRVIHQELKTGIEGGVAITAYILVAFQVIQNPTFSTTVSLGVAYLEKQLSTVTDLYFLSIVAYALKLSKSSKAQEAFDKLKGSLTKEGNQAYVKVTEPRPDVSQYCYYGTPTRNVEATGYTLMTFILFNDIPGGLPLMRWLTNQRNEKGGFTSTQDTAIGLEALAKMAASTFPSTDSTVKISFTYENAAAPVSFNVNKDNAIVLQSAVIPNNVRKVTIKAEGKGIVLAQVAWRYNVMNENSPNQVFFTLTVNVNKDPQTKGYDLEICTSIPGGSKSDEMSIVEVTLPSGYEFDTEKNPTGDLISQVDLENQNTMMSVYFTTLTNEETCFNAIGVFKVSVDKLKETTVSVYAYYEPANRITVPYLP